MTPAVICIIVFVCLITMVLVGFPIAVSMLVCGFVGFLSVSGLTITITQFTNSMFNLSHSYTFSVLPLFMTVGVLASVSGMAEGTFVAAKKWVGKSRGGLLYTVVVANMIFGACSGIASAGNIVFTKIALPELRKNGYDEKLSIGTIISAGSLSSLIPPSVSLVIFSLLVNVSIGSALIAGVGTGIVFAIILCLMVFAYGKIQPHKVPISHVEKVPLKEKLKTLTLIGPIVLLFAIIVGGTFFGWFAATAAGAVALVVIIIYSLLKRVPIKKVFAGVLEGTMSFAMVFLIVVAGQFFGRFVTVTGVTKFLVTAITSSGLPPYGTFLLIFVFYIFIGCIMDTLSAIIITVPLTFPVLTALGYHPLVVIIMIVFIMEIAQLTPPIGFGVFYVANSAELPVKRCFQAVVPFIIMNVLLVMATFIIPDLVLWLPKLMGIA